MAEAGQIGAVTAAWAAGGAATRKGSRDNNNNNSNEGSSNNNNSKCGAAVAPATTRGSTRQQQHQMQQQRLGQQQQQQQQQQQRQQPLYCISSCKSMCIYLLLLYSKHFHILESGGITPSHVVRGFSIYGLVSQTSLNVDGSDAFAGFKMHAPYNPCVPPYGIQITPLLIKGL